MFSWDGGAERSGHETAFDAVHSGPLHLHLRRLLYSSYTLSTRKLHIPFVLHRGHISNFRKIVIHNLFLQSLIRSWPSQQTHPKLANYRRWGAQTRGYDINPHYPFSFSKVYHLFEDDKLVSMELVLFLALPTKRWTLKNCTVIAAIWDQSFWGHCKGQIWVEACGFIDPTQVENDGSCRSYPKPSCKWFIFSHYRS